MDHDWNRFAALQRGSGGKFPPSRSGDGSLVELGISAAVVERGGAGRAAARDANEHCGHAGDLARLGLGGVARRGGLEKLGRGDGQRPFDGLAMAWSF